MPIPDKDKLWAKLEGKLEGTGVRPCKMMKRGVKEFE